ncbi:trypsin-like serine peptidase [Streptomyces sp. URMC 125]|uniref:trypsin-like serine peptidase n=1 Tax=Streptomyces sp. URMC 125 TaxID=3423419 RepID=UPI003F1D843A
MSSVSRRRSALAAAALAAALTVTTAACGPEDGGGDTGARPSASAPTGSAPGGIDLGDIRLPDELPAALKDFDPEKWKNGEWRNWDRDRWLREAKDFVNPVIEGLWDPGRMKDAEENDRRVDDGAIDDGSGGAGDEGVTDPEPRPRRAQPVEAPYRESAPAVGKVFMDTPKGAMVCSGTVVKDPNNPGRSNLVATAGHCVHAGKNGGWFRNIVFVPSYNDAALGAAELERASREEVAPHGVYWATWTQTTDHWIANGAEAGGAGASQDFAVLHVEPEEEGGASLEETVGAAVEVDFGTPAVSSLPSVTAHGYPAAPPFDGLTMHTCTDRPGRLTLGPPESTMYRIGCTMTGGSSGGGWFAQGPSGGSVLVSVTSIGTLDHTWLAGPRLGDEAEDVLKAVSGKYAGGR